MTTTNLQLPQHPGFILRDIVLPRLKINVTHAARKLGVTRAPFSQVIHAHNGISPKMALRLELLLKDSDERNAEDWLRLQAAFDVGRLRCLPALPILPIAKMGITQKQEQQGVLELAV